MILSAGTPIRVKLDWPELRGPCHIRTPHYVRGKPGRVVRHLGDFPNPEDLAFARPAEVVSLYHVQFSQSDLWPKADPYPRNADDDLLIELYAHWLEDA